MFLTPASQIGALVMTVVCLFTALGGGRTQRIAAGVLFLAWIASAALENREHSGPQYATFALDGLVLVIFCGLAALSRRHWMIWVAAFQLLTTATHLAPLLDPRIYSLAYATAYMIWSYLLLAALAWGGVEGWLERRRRSR